MIETNDCNPNVVDNDEKLEEGQDSSILPSGFFYEICFKICTHIFCYENCDLVLPCLVIVQADRGYDIGVAFRLIPEEEIQPSGKTIRKILSVITNDDKYIKYMLQNKAKSEIQALAMAKTICSELKVGPIVNIISVEFQADRKKLTVYYKKHADVSLCKLIRKLHSAFKMRIWMENVEPILLLGEESQDESIPQAFQKLEDRYFTLASIDLTQDPSENNPEILNPYPPSSQQQHQQQQFADFDSTTTIPSTSTNAYLSSKSLGDISRSQNINYPTGSSYLQNSDYPQFTTTTSQNHHTHMSDNAASYRTPYEELGNSFNYIDRIGISPQSTRTEYSSGSSLSGGDLNLAPAKYFQYNRSTSNSSASSASASATSSSSNSHHSQRRNLGPNRMTPPVGYADYLPQPPPSYNTNSPGYQTRRALQTPAQPQYPRSQLTQPSHYRSPAVSSSYPQNELDLYHSSTNNNWDQGYRQHEPADDYSRQQYFDNRNYEAERYRPNPRMERGSHNQQFHHQQHHQNQQPYNNTPAAPRYPSYQGSSHRTVLENPTNMGYYGRYQGDANRHPRPYVSLESSVPLATHDMKNYPTEPSRQAQRQVPSESSSQRGLLSHSSYLTPNYGIPLSVASSKSPDSLLYGEYETYDSEVSLPYQGAKYTTTTAPSNYEESRLFAKSSLELGPENYNPHHHLLQQQPIPQSLGTDDIYNSPIYHSGLPSHPTQDIHADLGDDSTNYNKF